MAKLEFHWSHQTND